MLIISFVGTRWRGVYEHQSVNQYIDEYLQNHINSVQTAGLDNNYKWLNTKYKYIIWTICFKSHGVDLDHLKIVERKQVNKTNVHF